MGPKQGGVFAFAVCCQRGHAKEAHTNTDKFLKMVIVRSCFSMTSCMHRNRWSTAVFWMLLLPLIDTVVHCESGAGLGMHGCQRLGAFRS